MKKKLTLKEVCEAKTPRAVAHIHGAIRAANKEQKAMVDNHKTNEKIKAFETFGEQALDRHFPKRKCKERGEAIVLFAELALIARKLFRD